MSIESILDNQETPSRSKNEVFIVDLEGFEGPLDLLLELSRKQKVDLQKVSILRLAEQYAEYIENARILNINLAADYLVMAAWLALIKSQLLLPEGETEEESENVLAARLAFRLQRLNAMRESAEAIIERQQLGQDFFPRGQPEQFSTNLVVSISANVLDLTQAYARIRSRDDYSPYSLSRDPIFPVDEALINIQNLLGENVDWRELIKFLPPRWTNENRKIRSALASTFTAALELARQGQLDMRQSSVFGPIHLKAIKQNKER